MRTRMRRFTRLTNALSKKVENHMWALALHYMHHNFAGFIKVCVLPRRWKQESQAMYGRLKKW